MLYFVIEVRIKQICIRPKIEQNMLAKQLIAYLIILSIGLHLFAELGIYFSFKLNQDYIAEFLCIEKDNPESTCQGCCQLKSKLEEHEKQKQDLPQSENKKYEIQLFTSKPAAELIPFLNIEKVIHISPSDTRISFAYSIFHPPKT